MSRRTLHTGRDLLTDTQNARLAALFAVDDHVEVEATWGIYQQMITAYRDPDRTRGAQLMQKVIDALSHGVPAELTELITLGRTLRRRDADVLAYFTRPGTSNGPTEAINGRLEHLRGSALAHQLHRQIPTRDRRLQTPATPSIAMSPHRPARRLSCHSPGRLRRIFGLHHAEAEARSLAGLAFAVTDGSDRRLWPWPRRPHGCHRGPDDLPRRKLDTSGGCGSLDISTDLTKADVATAQKICEAASTIAYAGAVKNVAVTGAGDVELAISVKGQPCVGEP